MTTVLRECFATARQGWKTTGYPVIILGTTCDIEKIPTGVLGAFKEEISIEAPGEPERHSMLKALTSSLTIAPDVSLRALAVQTAALVANDLVDLVRRARSAAASRALAVLGDGSLFEMRDVQHAGLALTAVDFNEALEKARSSYSESIGAPKIPSVTWDDVGGLANVKTDILDTIQLPLEHPELFADGLKKRSGNSCNVIGHTRIADLCSSLDQESCSTGHLELERRCSRKQSPHRALSISSPSRVPSCSTCILENPRPTFVVYSSAPETRNRVSSFSTSWTRSHPSEAIKATLEV